MRNQIALIDTNIIIHRETINDLHDGIGLLFKRLQLMGYTIAYHEITYQEIMKYHDEQVRKAINIKLQNYSSINESSMIRDIDIVNMLNRDRDHNSKNDTLLLNEVVEGRVDILITQDKGIHGKAMQLEIQDQVYTIDSFLEKTQFHFQDSIEYKALKIQRKPFKKIDINDPFFNSLRDDYNDFNKWFLRKSEEIAYVYFDEEKIIGFLYIKYEPPSENYSDITPYFRPCHRLKIGTFKVTFNGMKLGERFLKVVFDNAIHYKVDEVYVTMFGATAGQEGLLRFLEKFGFIKHGVKKTTIDRDELVYIRPMCGSGVDHTNPMTYFPYIMRSSKAFLVSIHKDFHTRLFPDSLLRGEKAQEITEDKAYQYAIIKSYISRSFETGLKCGDVILFYRCGEFPAEHRSVVTTVGVVLRVYSNIKTEKDLIRITRGKTVLKEKEISSLMKKIPHPFVIEFLYCKSLKKRLTRKELLAMEVIRNRDDRIVIYPIPFKKIEEVLIRSEDDNYIIDKA